MLEGMGPSLGASVQNVCLSSETQHAGPLPGVTNKMHATEGKGKGKSHSSAVTPKWGMLC